MYDEGDEGFEDELCITIDPSSFILHLPSVNSVLSVA
jgi:hypothetical protein